ncbi:MAG: zinc ribbon domain-containing protein [Candidatus Heimdallarchaeota archaeon]|nr:zinc ribbon domain-containing protein [Candidatus Heimdallarchaeota archaeon]MCK4771093.1 zinc ribbon domain-containing protein [Candidatus Heimdallarchaeota archaeon]
MSGVKKLVEKVKKKISSSGSSKDEITRRSQLQDVPPVPQGLAVEAPTNSAPSPTKQEIPIPENMLPEEQPKPKKEKKPEEILPILQCPHCDKELNEDFEFCPYCGKSIKLACSNCKRELAEDFEFCPYCGDEIEK